MSPGGSRLPLIAGNWKMNNTHLEAIALVQKLAFSLTGKDFAAAEVVVLPPFTALRSVQTLITGDKLQIGYGAQDISVHDQGAYTGEVSGPMLAKLGCGYVLAGHSERRRCGRSVWLTRRSGTSRPAAARRWNTLRAKPSLG